MHVIFRETHGLEETAVPQDLGQDPADLVVLSFSDSDLGAFAAAWRQSRLADPTFPSLRLANLAALAHPLSVDTYVARTLCGAKAILIRLIGGAPYWSYGLQQIEALARAKAIALAILPADGRANAQLEATSTTSAATLHELTRLCELGGAEAARAALFLLAGAAGFATGPIPECAPLPTAGGWRPDLGVCDPTRAKQDPNRPLVVILFYRSYLAAGDLDPFIALHQEFENCGINTMALFVTSLKELKARAQVETWLRELAPAAIINATAFSARDSKGDSPLDGTGVPVFQLALATATRTAWSAASRGLSAADLSMHVVLPEFDARVFLGVASFKEPGQADKELGFALYRHCADQERIAAICSRVASWIRLGRKPAAQRRIALVLSSYPGKTHQMAHAVGLDALASAGTILADLAQAGHLAAPVPDLVAALQGTQLCWSLAQYRQALLRLPTPLRDAILQKWGEPESDPAAIDREFRFAAVKTGNIVIALQPERGHLEGRAEEYHDLAGCPRHAYAAFYLWLRAQDIDALVHVGAHGTLEWLPGKSVALSSQCWPEALTGPMPVIYPFIVNDPGEAAQAKRRIGAVTIGHAPPPMIRSGEAAGLGQIEALLDEFSNASGLDPARRDRLQRDICEEAKALGLEAELGLRPEMSLSETLTRIDRFVCDVKESQFGEGLHVFGRGLCGDAERDGLLAALSGRRVPPGPSGSPFRGRTDVLPTGRNLFTVDPRSVPTRAAFRQGVVLAEELLRRHLQDHGDYPRGLVVDLWGSSTMRTAGEEFAMALYLLGAKPLWDTGTERVAGFEILPLAQLDRPRIDVTLRISGLFRDAFPTLPVLFGQTVQALCQRDEPEAWNPFACTHAAPRVYGPKPGDYGLGMGNAIELYTGAARVAAGKAWLAASAHTFDLENGGADPEGLRQRVAQADAFVHCQDLAETDLLLSSDYAAHEAGFAAAQAVTGGNAALYHLDSRNPQRPVTRALSEEIARVVRARAANPKWIEGMMRHGFRGGAEIAATLDHLGTFAHLSGSVPPQLFDLYYEATVGQSAVRDFLARENPEALAAMTARFAALHAAGLWSTRRNSILVSLPSPCKTERGA